jgi:hypothetical protein
MIKENAWDSFYKVFEGLISELNLAAAASERAVGSWNKCGESWGKCGESWSRLPEYYREIQVQERG